ncbi:Mg(2+) transporter ALR1 [Lachancea thermotolerans CBS 6340]|uniref:KLTH0F19008p n=1 Tax=Lachancea thermotolerans (strain ATCC 56472 / CBS 6340 / NRRL Y-8284) TaxID=559295 RepID=C5DJT6_LACTC|nr:KLTH0F19008p [Lachancea thermotolerans CBS 6340]CAR24575.1 KLTH0F19008p [Lachancea thermotolerans CBS 6340]
MGSDSESQHSTDNISTTASVAVSLASMGTQEHNELYDHRKQPDSLPVRHSSELGKSESRRAPLSTGRTEALKISPGSIRSGITFENESDEEELQIRSPQMKPSTTSTNNARPSRLAHSMPHQKQLYTSSGASQYITAPPPLNPRKSSKFSNVEDAGNMKKAKPRAGSDSSSVKPMHLLSKTISARSNQSESNIREQTMRRRVSRASIETDNSHASRESQETEEDVCFPMERLEHTRINGIDFDELEEFAIQSREEYINAAMNGAEAELIKSDDKYLNKAGSSSSTSTVMSAAALKYTPRPTSESKEPRIGQQESTDSPQGIFFGNNKVENDDSEQLQASVPSQVGNYLAPDRFSFFCSDSEETVHAADIASLVKPGETFRELFRDGAPTWWLDCVCPTDEEMRCISKAFGLHPLTAEDIRMQETREKVELFKTYYFVCFHTFEGDNESEDFLEPINVYIVIFKEGVLTFHFGPIYHCSNVRRRVRQLRDYVDVSSDWLCYALIDDITDSFAPVIQAIEYEADVIEDSVFMARDMDFAHMLQRIGESRRKTMTLMRLLSGKADVIKMFAKRCQDEVNGIGPALTSQLNIANLQFSQTRGAGVPPKQSVQTSHNLRAQPRADIALYLGDIQDHVLTMFQNLLSYEKIFSRSHANYLAQLQVESFNSNNKVTEMLSKVTLIGTILVPLNLVTGLFGMNVRVPGGDQSQQHTYAWFFGILGVMIFLAVSFALISTYWMGRLAAPSTLNEASESGTRSILNTLRPRGSRTVGKTDAYKKQNTNRSISSFQR